ncbi:MAG: HAMP domain-containing sensor histidine kinase, partial [Acidimicrobiia bacterium]|nr:HAMP domain-containing sensor histidine kinase [Acidimicrobiia bacterium]
MASQRAFVGTAGQSILWFVAALLVVSGSVLVASWLSSTSNKVDRATLDRGADAMSANIEEQIRLLELAGTGAQSLVGQPTGQLDITGLVSQIDTSVFQALLGVVSYPVTDAGVLEGKHVDLDLTPFDFAVPQIEVTLEEVEELSGTGHAFFSRPLMTTDPDRFDYVVAIPVELGEDTQLVGVVFRPDKVLDAAVEGTGEGQYAAELVDRRHGDLVVASNGQPAADLESRRSPDGTSGYLDILVRPGTDFPFSQSGWIPALVIAGGILIALLLIWVGRISQARAADLAERLRLAQELNESKDRFLATVSHELRTPLTVVLGVAAEVGPNWEQLVEADRQDLLAMMSEQAHEASNIVEDLLVAAHSDPSRLRLALERTPLQPHLEYALASLPVETLSRIRWTGSEQIVTADRTRLRQILRNLLENAVKY